MSTSVSSPREPRRRFSAEFKAQLVAQCGESKEAVYTLAQAHDIAPSLLQKWIRQHKHAEQGVAPSFVPIPIVVPNATVSSVISITVAKSSMNVTVSWPLTAQAQCTAWLCEWLQ